ncbi:MAG TPA: MG2 domain-containing protein [Candidatus Kapabacteria bacterium]|nr:MG2 domain-containing protein [Candidatus Kapabacteria bacterium]
MNLRSFATRSFIILAAMMAFAFDGDDNSFSFSLSVEQIFYPGAAETAVNFGGNAVGKVKVYMRAFRIPDPVDFFMNQKDPHAPSLASLNPPNTFEMLRQGVEKVQRDVRYAARSVMPADARRAIRDVADLNGTKAEKERQQREHATPRDPNKLAVDDIPKGAEHYPIVATWEHELNPKPEESGNWHYESIPVPVKEKGVYLIEARVRGKRALTTLVISEYGMVMKQSTTELLAFVVNTRTGERVGDVPLVVTRAGEKITDKTTAADGTARVAVPAPPKHEHAATSQDDPEDEWQWDYRMRTLLVLGEKDGNFVISDPYFYNYGSGNSPKIYLHTDRPVYRPGHTVYYRGIVRNTNTDGTYTGPQAGQRMVAEIDDARGDSFRRDTLALSDAGTFNSQFVISDEPPLGIWSVKVYAAGASSDEAQYFNFSVEEYKKPEYKVVVTTDRATYTRGDEIKATVKADYYFGSPVANAEVEYFVYRARYWRPWWRGSDWAYLYEGSDDDDFATYRMEMVHSAKGVLNPDGTFQIDYRTDPAADRDYVYRVQANVVDNSRRMIAGAKSVEVTRGEYFITMSTDKYVYRPNDEAKISVEVATCEGEKPVATPFTAKVIRTWWDKVKNDSVPNGFVYKAHYDQVWSGSGATDASGKGTLTYKPSQPGYFEMEVSVTDRRGTQITESSYIYVADQAYANWYREGSSDVQIIPDKAAYKPGETMSALVIMPAPNVDALVTLEGATLYSSQVERLNGTSAIVRIPIEEKHAPTVFLSASAIVDGEMYHETQRVSVVPDGKLLHMEVTTDKQTYRPGEKGTVTVRALDEKGSPVGNVDVAVGMVDEAIYAIRPENTPDIQRSFYGARWNEVSTSSSLNFSFYGDAVKIDKDATDALYGYHHGHPVYDSLAHRLASGLSGARAIAFGDVKGSMFVQPATRRNFKDMMFWTPSARTGSDGRATMTVDFPDNLTTWRITARGITNETAVGQATARVVERKELLVRMETPRFLIQGDELLIATTVHNYLSTAKTTKVAFGGENVSLGDREKTVTIPANGEQRIDWKVSAQYNGTALLNVKALTNEESDAMELTVPVLPRGMKLATGAVTQLDGPTAARTLNLQLPSGADPKNGDVYIALSPSLAGSMLGTLDSLIGYPYGCVEQTMSRFLPTVVVADVLKKLDVPFDEKRRAEIPRMVSRGFSKLYGMQHEDGGWGWWTWDQTDPYMTAYVMYGLTAAQRAGYEVNKERYDNGHDALMKLLVDGGERGHPLDATTQAYMVYVLATIDKGKPQKALVDRIRAMARVETLSDYSRALLTLAAKAQGMQDVVSTLDARLEADATPGTDYAFWQPKGLRWFWQNDPVEATAFAVKAILETKGETQLAQKGVQWLLSQKLGDTWENTKTTALVIYALVDYIKSSGQLNPDYTLSVKINGREVFTRHITRADVFVPEQRVQLHDPNLVNGTNAVSIEKNGPGRLYASARMVYYATGPALRSASSGFKVVREYYTLTKARRGDIYVYTKQPFRGTVRTGDELFVKVRVVPDRSYEYFMLEDPLPAGCEVVTNTDGYTIAGEKEYDQKTREENVDDSEWWWWYSDRNVRDEKVTFFAREIPRAPFEFSYVMRAQIPGTYSVMPSVAELMYYPEVRGNGDAVNLTITP